jgi:cyclase
MLRTRVVPALLISGSGLVKTERFTKRRYVGDAINSARIYNQMAVDELFLFDIDATAKGQPIQLDLIEEAVSECFMPICYGGGVRAIEDFDRLFQVGIEKVSVSSLLFDDPAVVREAVAKYGAQSIVGTLDVRRSRVRRSYQLATHNGRRVVSNDLAGTIRAVNSLGVGEVVVNNIDRDGTWSGFDCELVRAVAESTRVPVVALGGAGTLEHIREVVTTGGAHAVALGSMAVFQAKGMGVLINFPSINELAQYVGEQ